MAHQRSSATDGAVFTRSLDLLSDPEIKKIRDSSKEKMTGLLLGLVNEGKEQGEVNKDLSEEACLIYLNAFMDIFVDPRLQHLYSSNPKIIHDLGTLMSSGLRGA
jgi:hypothetical protein